MKTQFVAALLVVLSASAAAPAFASGYGPAPFYKPSVGAPVAQRGQSVQALAAERDAAAGPQSAYGGVASGIFQSGNHAVVNRRDDLYSRH